MGPLPSDWGPPLPSDQAPLPSVRGPSTAPPNISSDSGLSAAARGYMDSMKSKLLVAPVSQPVGVGVAVAAVSTHTMAGVAGVASSSSLSRGSWGEKKEVVNDHGSDSLDETNQAATAVSTNNMSTSLGQAIALSAASSDHGLDFSQSASSPPTASASAAASSIEDKQQSARSVVLTKEEIGTPPT